MKKYITIGLIAVLLVFATLLSWQHIKASRDARIRQNLVGTWIMDVGSYTVRPDFSYVLQVTNATQHRLITNEGAFQVRDGFLIDTLTKCGYTTNIHVPYVTRSRIIQADASQMVILENDEGGVVKIVLRKETI